MIKSLLIVTAASALGLAALAVSENGALNDEGEETVTLDQVPAAVREAILKATRGAEIKEIERETENGKTVYEVEATLKGVVFELEFDDGGALIEFEIEDDEDDDGDDDDDAEREEGNRGDAARNEADDDGDDGDDDGDDEETISLDRVPEAARRAILQQAGSAAIEEVEVEHEGGAKLYEAAWKVNGVEHEVLVTAEGDLVALEEIVSAATAPKPVQTTAANAFPKGAALTYEKKTLVLYEVETEADGRERGVLIVPTGQRVEIEADDDDKDD